jgi:hypothetical protein
LFIDRIGNGRSGRFDQFRIGARNIHHDIRCSQFKFDGEFSALADGQFNGRDNGLFKTGAFRRDLIVARGQADDLVFTLIVGTDRAGDAGRGIFCRYCRSGDNGAIRVNDGSGQVRRGGLRLG